MPKAYRTMFEDEGCPRIGKSFCCLGVREPGGPGRADVDVEEDGRVVMNRKGMSVFRSLNDLAALPARIVPPHLRSLVPGAAAPPGTRVFAIGDGDFVSGPIGEGLALTADPGRVHGSIGPADAMSLAEFQSALAATQNDWVIEES